MSCDCAAGRFVLSVCSNNDTRCALSIGVWGGFADTGVDAHSCGSPFLPVHQWGFGSLGVSALVAGFAAVSFWMLGQLVSKLSHSAALGGGDVLLLAACCLFLEARCLSTYVLLIALFGIVLALAWLFIK